jgi:hypothetical protein
MKNRIVITTLLSALLWAPAFAQAPPPLQPLQPLPSLDAAAYMGKLVSGLVVSQPLPEAVRR